MVTLPKTSADLTLLNDDQRIASASHAMVLVHREREILMSDKGHLSVAVKVGFPSRSPDCQRQISPPWTMALWIACLPKPTSTR